MSKTKLARNVTVGGTTYGPGDDVPEDVVKQITNPKAWIPEGDDEADDEDDGRDAGTAGGHKLATSVTVGGKTYGPKDYIPDDVASTITNPKAWADGKVPAAPVKAAAPGPEHPAAGVAKKPGPPGDKHA